MKCIFTWRWQAPANQQLNDTSMAVCDSNTYCRYHITSHHITSHHITSHHITNAQHERREAQGQQQRLHWRSHPDRVRRNKPRRYLQECSSDCWYPGLLTKSHCLYRPPTPLPNSTYTRRNIKFRIITKGTNCNNRLRNCKNSLQKVQFSHQWWQLVQFVT
jgi:hypothetical protein